MPQKLTAHRPGFEGLNGPDYTTNPDVGAPFRRERGQPDSMFAETAPPAGGPRAAHGRRGAAPAHVPRPLPWSGIELAFSGLRGARVEDATVGKHSKTRVSDLQGSYTSNVMTKRFAMSRTRSQTFQSCSDGQSLRLGTKRRRRRLLDIRTALDVMKVVHHARS